MTEAERMTVYWTWWRLLWCVVRFHILTHDGPNYPGPVCWECESKRLHESSDINLGKDRGADGS